MMIESKNKKELMREIKDEVLNLTESPLYEYRKQNNYFPVIGEGNHNAKIMFIGEAPGLNEAKTGRPFCGSAGKILDELLENVGIKREDIYVGNILKDRPQQNRDPLPAEIKIYGPFLNRQINIIQPKVIATLGRYSMDYIMRKFELETELLPIGQMHGKVFDAKAEYGDVKIAVLYHPAVAIYNNKTKDTLKEDFKVLKKFI